MATSPFPPHYFATSVPYHTSEYPQPGFTSSHPHYMSATGQDLMVRMATSTMSDPVDGRQLYGVIDTATGIAMAQRQAELMYQMAYQGVHPEQARQYVQSIMVGGGGASDGITSNGGSGGSGSVYYSQQATETSMPQSVPTTVTQFRPPQLAASADLDAATELTSDMVDGYGAAEMQRSAALSDKLLSLIGQDNGGEFSEKLNDLVLVAKGLDPTEAAKQRGLWRKFLNWIGVKTETAQSQYKMLDAQISTLAGELGVHSKRQDGRKRDLESLYQENSDSYGEIEKLVLKGRAFLAKPISAPLAEVKSGMEAQKLADDQSLRHRLDKRITDLDVAMTLMLQTAPEIRIMQANAQALIDKFTTLVNLTIPAWKKQFALHVLQLEQKRSATVADAVDDATNDAFVKNASMLHDNTMQVAASGQRQIMDMATVEHVQGEILRTVADVRQLNADASASRAQIAGKLEHIRDDLVKSVAGQHVQIDVQKLARLPVFQDVTTTASGITSPQIREISK